MRNYSNPSQRQTTQRFVGTYAHRQSFLGRVRCADTRPENSDQHQPFPSYFFLSSSVLLTDGWQSLTYSTIGLLKIAVIGRLRLL